MVVLFELTLTPPRGGTSPCPRGTLVGKRRTYTHTHEANHKTKTFSINPRVHVSWYLYTSSHAHAISSANDSPGRLTLPGLTACLTQARLNAHASPALHAARFARCARCTAAPLGAAFGAVASPPPIGCFGDGRGWIGCVGRPPAVNSAHRTTPAVNTARTTDPAQTIPMGRWFE